MRRQDLAITDPNEIDAIIRSCDCCRLGFADEGKAYIVPLNFGYENTDGKRVLYFHGASEGRKLDMIKKYGFASFEMDTNHKLNTNDAACDHSFRYQCVMGEGPITLITDRDAKAAGLQIIMAQFTGKSDWEFNEAVLAKTSLFRLEIRELSARAHK